MSLGGGLATTVALLSAAVVIVPIMQRLGLGAVLGYLAAGVLVGPAALTWVTEVEFLRHFSELGVVLFLFLVGLELEPKKLWQLRLSIFGLGTAQMLATAGVAAGALILLDWSPSEALMGGLGLALSSTAIGLTLMRERNFLPTTAGQAGFSVLLFQDLAIIPILALLPVYAPLKAQGGVENPHAWIVASVIVGIIVGGRILLRPVLRFVASAHLRETFTALALFLVLGISLVMEKLHLSMGLGAFLAGVLLADSEYRHALETDLEPFRGLLLGLFFMTVGMSIPIEAVLAQPLALFLGVGFILALKIALLLSLARIFKIPRSQATFFSLVLSQVGEFAFVLFAMAKEWGFLSSEKSGLLLAIVALSMVSTPILLWVYDRITARKEKTSSQSREADKIEDESHPVIIAGFGRFGQIIGRLLHANGIGTTVLDYEPEQIELLRRFGFKVYYGDATRLDLLEAAGAAKAKILVVAIDDVDASIKLIDLVREHFPHLKIVARARNVQHVYELIDRNVSVWERELFEGSLNAGTEVLRLMGWTAFSAQKAAHRFRDHNIAMIMDLAPQRKNQKEMATRAQAARDDLAKMMAKEHAKREDSESAWNTQ